MDESHTGDCATSDGVAGGYRRRRPSVAAFGEQIVELTFGAFGTCQGLGAGVLQGLHLLRGLRARLLQPITRFGTGGREIGRRAPARLGEFGAQGVGVSAQALQFGPHLLGGLSPFGGGLFRTLQGALDIGGALDGQITFSRRGRFTLGTLPSHPLDLGVGGTLGPSDLLVAPVAEILLLLFGFRADGAYLVLGRAARREDIVGGAGGDLLDFTQGFVAVPYGRTGAGFRFGDARFGVFGCSRGVFGGFFGPGAGVVGVASGLFGCGGSHIGFGDTASSFGLYRLDLRLGRGRVGEGVHFGDRGGKSRTELVGEGAELGE